MMHRHNKADIAHVYNYINVLHMHVIVSPTERGHTRVHGKPVQKDDSPTHRWVG